MLIMSKDMVEKYLFVKYLTMKFQIIQLFHRLTLRQTLVKPRLQWRRVIIHMKKHWLNC
nr:MAG TPA: hypothetical protein [Caudoviricetes sp.]